MKVLIVEDDIVSRELLRVVVQKEGYECMCAEDGIQGLETFNEFLPDIVISDIRMPRLDGIGLLKKIRQVERNVIVIIVTAHGNEQIALQTLQLGANNYIKKPIHLEELKILLSRYNNVLINKLSKADVSSLIVKRNLELVIDSDLDLVPSVSEYLVKQVTNLYTPSELISIELGLSELLINAIEHGSFNISNEDKKEALKLNSLTQLYYERSLIPEYAERKISIDFNQNGQQCEWIISDEGNGFNYNYIPNPNFDKIVTELHGRGVFISKLQFDTIEYSGNGNIVKAIKIRKK